ncbi:hypothetical protein MXD62_34885 [Frankia sp. Mgl5]|nr:MULTISPECIES: hypothetical protein [Frankiaceae]ABW10139.1 conserved hypothetical protein [Frankia sp. EAN1pec]MCK9932270.1 hypothetical protein [Frankia sp. Mgl5]CAI7973474.1 conserved hypothetical protein [Frankia sp. Hr75.2]SQD94143.1 conserved hypothetical protein [Parafrankia sp. Ea1.12]
MGDAPLPDHELPSDEREIGWGDETLLDENEADADLARLLADLPPHHVER